MEKMIRIFDTTLRDGEQSPGCSMNLEEKIVMAKQLEALKVDIIEAGFAIASPGDFRSVKEIARVIKDSTVASLSRTLEKDIWSSYEALKDAVSPRIHTFIATSDIHMKYKLKQTPDEVVESAVAGVKYAKRFISDVEFSCEDATRSRKEFLYRIIKDVIDAGATVINIPDTVGYATPFEMFNLVKDVKENVPNIHKAQISVHCHNDLGLGVANSLYAVLAGADQVECTMNGIGERAGNASLEEIVMALATRRDYYNAITRLDTTQIMKASKLLTSITGVAVQPNKAIVGANAFSHEAGIHQHGMLENRSTYEIMTPESVGLNVSKMVLGKHSGRHAFKDRIVSLGYELSDEEIDAAFKEFKILADKKKQVFDEDIVSIIERDEQNDQEFTLEKFDIVSRKGRPSEATVWLRKQNESMEAVENGDGPVDASFKAVEKIVGKEIELLDYTLHSITEGQDAMGKATVKIQAGEYNYNGKGVSTDVVEASIKAFIDAINKSMKNGKKHEERMTV